MRSPAFVLALVLLAVSPAAATAPRVHVLGAAARVALWERFETTGSVQGAEGNPFDPDAVDLRGEFETPDGQRLQLPGFVTRDFRRALVAGREELTPSGRLHWKVRFTPTRVGRWRWRWRVATPQGEAASPWRPLYVSAAPQRVAGPPRHGFLRVSSRDARYLRFDDGTPWFAIGENLSWYDARGSFAYDAWLERLAEQGVSYVRLWMPSWAFGLEVVQREGGVVVWTSLGDYTQRLDRAWQLDRIFEAAEARGIQIMLCIQNHGPFSLTSNSEWADNPYNAANGGPLAQPQQVFTDPQARRLFERRLRYLVARWGYATNLLAWELWNEVDLVERADAPEVLAWHAEMARALRALDPYHHLVTTSVTSGSPRTRLWTLPEIDLTQAHAYAHPFHVDTGSFLSFFVSQARVPGKPVLIGEWGSDWRGPSETLATDPAHIGFHDGLWAGVLTGTFGTAMSWWWDNVVDPEDLYSHFGAVARFAQGIAFDAQGFVAGRPPAVADGRRLQAYALVGERTALAWIKNLDDHYAPPGQEAGGSSGDPTPVEGATLALAGLADGAWRARWIDTRDGSAQRTDAVDVANGAVALAVPDFVGDLALRLERE